MKLHAQRLCVSLRRAGSEAIRLVVTLLTCCRRSKEPPSPTTCSGMSNRRIRTSFKQPELAEPPRAHLHPCLLDTATTASRTCRGSRPEASFAGGVEQLDRVAGGILEEDLLASRPGDDVVPEGHAFGAKTLDLGLDVVHNE